MVRPCCQARSHNHVGERSSRDVIVIVKLRAKFRLCYSFALTRLAFSRLSPSSLCSRNASTTGVPRDQLSAFGIQWRAGALIADSCQPFADS
jgi:hypothetical protein